MSVGFLSSPPLWTSGASPAGESEGRAGNAEPTHSAAGEQLPGVGTLTWPVQQEITGQLQILLFSIFYFVLSFNTIVRNLKHPWQFPMRVEDAEGVLFFGNVLKMLIKNSRLTLSLRYARLRIQSSAHRWNHRNLSSLSCGQ